MKPVASRAFRVREMAPDEYVAQEFLKWRWRTIGYNGELEPFAGSSSTCGSAQERIERRKERLMRADEFPRLALSEQWDGKQCSVGRRFVSMVS